MFPSAPTIQVTKNYKLFKNLSFNREINNANYTKLLEETRKNFQLHRFPILVNSKYEIIDGQHRFQVAKELDAPIYFIRDLAVHSDFNAVHSVNKAGRVHSIRDKFKMLLDAGDTGAIQIETVYLHFEEKFDIMTVAQALMSGSIGSSDARRSIDFHDKIVLNNLENGFEVLNALHNAERLPERYKSFTVYALNKLAKYNNISPTLICERLNENLIKWISPKSRKDAEEAILRTYNYHLHSKNQLSSVKKV